MTESFFIFISFCEAPEQGASFFMPSLTNSLTKTAQTPLQSQSHKCFLLSLMLSPNVLIVISPFLNSPFHYKFYAYFELLPKKFEKFTKIVLTLQMRVFKICSVRTILINEIGY